MIATDDLARKRAVLLDAQLRFAPQVQPVKESAIDSMVEQILFVGDATPGLSLQGIQNQFSTVADGFSVSVPELRASLKRLTDARRVLGNRPRERRVFRLANERRDQIATIRDESEARYSRVVTELFEHATEGPESYSDPLLLCLSIAIARVIEENIQWLVGDDSGVIDQPSINDAVVATMQRFSNIDSSALHRGVTRFFRDANPDCNAIKWNLAQNYFVMRTIGMHEGSRLLSDEVFRGAVLYLDTNVLIRILDETSPEHHAFKGLARTCEDVNVCIYVCRPSIDELKNWVNVQYELIKKINSTVPTDLVTKVESRFLERYRSLADAHDSDPDMDEVLGRYQSPEASLQELFGIQVVDDPWFSDPKNYRHVEEFATALVGRTTMNTRGPKTMGSAMVDANVILWIDKRASNAERHWLVTLDRSLPGAVPRRSKMKSLAMPLPALLLWISPIADMISDDMPVPDAFTRLLGERLLPPERIFDANDFLFLYEMGVESRLLPADDVVELIQYIKAQAGHLDPSKAEDREQLSRKVQGFLASPERKFHQELDRVTKENQQIRSDNQRLLEEQSRSSRELNEQIQDLRYRLDEERESGRSAVEQLRHEWQNERDEHRCELLRRSALLRLVPLGILLIASWTTILWLAVTYGDGENAFLNLVIATPLLLLCYPVVVWLAWLLIGRERLGLLPWFLRKVMKVDANEVELLKSKQRSSLGHD